MNKKIPFTLPDITQAEINEVVKTLKSGWITTGKKTKEFESALSKFCCTEKTICLNSATAGMELILKLFDIGNGDEVITTPYTFAATANVILHVGAKPVFVDIKPNEFNIDPDKINKAITSKTKAIISVDIAGLPADFDNIKNVLHSNKKKYKPKKNTLQSITDRPIILSDAAHSLGAVYNKKMVGGLADFTVFSFHATKNLTTAEGGAITFNSFNSLPASDIYKKLSLLSLHGQSKDAFSKLKAGGWQYSIELPGYKYNMPDLCAAIGLSQLQRYQNKIIPKRKNICDIYNKELYKYDKFILPCLKDSTKTSSYHLYLLRIKNADEKIRAEIISKMASKNISCNVHFIPLVMQPLYKKLGYSIKNFPNAFAMYQNEISLPLSSIMTKKDALIVCNELKKISY